jgi:hypothetical protein
MKLDKDKPYGSVHGLAGVAFEQDGKHYNRFGDRIGVATPSIPPDEAVAVAAPRDDLVKPVQRATMVIEMPSPRDWKVPDEVLQDERIKDEPIAKVPFQCPECEFVGRNPKSLKAHQRHKGH